MHRDTTIARGLKPNRYRWRAIKIAIAEEPKKLRAGLVPLIKTIDTNIRNIKPFCRSLCIIEFDPINEISINKVIVILINLRDSNQIINRSIEVLP